MPDTHRKLNKVGGSTCLLKIMVSVMGFHSLAAGQLATLPRQYSYIMDELNLI